MKLFGYVLIASKTDSYKTQTVTASGLLLHESMETAEKHMDDYAVKEFPITKGWSDHRIKLTQSADVYTFPDGRRFNVEIKEVKE